MVRRRAALSQVPPHCYPNDHTNAPAALHLVSCCALADDDPQKDHITNCALITSEEKLQSRASLASS
ncbi:unnamed protein product [Toxocara canis]|uniref:Uncharacterized protein n=1 Tax=Toxocara canis TaxID=6265 RepID=A0A183V6K2_TOXCA|nr:unnamed protein product [Toxocara canis]